MNKQTERALRGSIKKWALIVEGKGKDCGSNNCPLCAMFFDAYCAGCPVSESVDMPYCDKTPYNKWLGALDAEREELLGPWSAWDDGDPQMVIGPRTMAAAIAEHDFLVSLLPEKTNG